MNSRAALIIAASLSLAGCPDKGAQPAGDDRLIAKLKAEKEREQKDGPTVPPTAVAEPPRDEKVNPLAEFAAKGTQKKELPVPGKTLLQVGKVSLRLNAIEATHSVGDKISVTTDDWFVKLSFNATGTEAVDLTSAHLAQGDKVFGFARDAQAASRKPATVTATSDGAVVWAYFEVPADALDKGLALVVPDGSGEARLELQ